MEDKIKKILDLLEGENIRTKQDILLECAVKVGTPEWEDAVKDLWRRMEDLEKG